MQIVNSRFHQQSDENRLWVCVSLSTASCFLPNQDSIVDLPVEHYSVHKTFIVNVAVPHLPSLTASVINATLLIVECDLLRSQLTAVSFGNNLTVITRGPPAAV
jgi:hypothetical protein